MDENCILVTFWVEKMFLGVEVAQVQEVLEAQPITQVPLAPQAISGLMNLRGEIVIAMDMRRRLSVPDAPPDLARMNIVVRTSDGPLSLVVDQIGDVLQPNADDIEPLPATLRGPVRAFASQIVRLPDQVLLILDAEKIAQLPMSTPQRRRREDREN